MKMNDYDDMMKKGHDIVKTSYNMLKTHVLFSLEQNYGYSLSPGI